MTDVASAGGAPAPLVQSGSLRACDTGASFADCLAEQGGAPDITDPPRGKPVDGDAASFRPIRMAAAAAVAERTSTGAMPLPSPILAQVLSASAPARLYPAHWFGNGYLSFCGYERSQALEYGPAGQQDSIGQRAVVDVPPGAAIRMEQDVVEARGAESAVARSPAALPSQQVNASEKDAEALSRTVGLSVVGDSIWALRRVRLTTQANGSTTAWLRDFTLKPNDLQQAIEAAVHQARIEGLRLERIVVNGREVWCSNTRTGEA